MTARFSEFAVAGLHDLLGFLTSHVSLLTSSGAVKRPGSQLIVRQMCLDNPWNADSNGPEFDSLVQQFGFLRKHT
mgnify:CR=1